MPARMLVTLSSAKPTNAKKPHPWNHRSGASHAARLSLDRTQPATRSMNSPRYEGGSLGGAACRYLTTCEGTHRHGSDEPAGTIQTSVLTR